MKKFYFLLAVALLAVSTIQAQCVIDTTHLPSGSPGVYPSADSLPCIHRTVLYSQTIQGRIQSSKDTTISGISGTITVDSVQIDTINGAPNGITWVTNPRTLYGGQAGCIKFSGTTSDVAGQYPLTAIGDAWLTINAAPILNNYAYHYHGDLNQFSSFGGYYLTVCADSTNNGINQVSAGLSASLEVYPNPSNGVFEVKLNTEEAETGEMIVIDGTGRIVYSQTISSPGFYNATINLSKFAKGVYTLQVRTANGFASKHISIE